MDCMGIFICRSNLCNFQKIQSYTNGTNQLVHGVFSDVGSYFESEGAPERYSYLCSPAEFA